MLDLESNTGILPCIQCHCSSGLFEALTMFSDKLPFQLPIQVSFTFSHIVTVFVSSLVHCILLLITCKKGNK